MKITTCICGGPIGHVEEVGQKDGREVAKCLECGAIRTLYIPEDYGMLYTDGDTYHLGRRGHIAYTERFQHDYKIAGLRFPRHLRHFRFLDVGCANGGWVKAASDLGFTVEGLELNPNMAEWARKTTGCTIHTDWSTVEGSFDMITYHDVIEHVEDPVAEIVRAREYLSFEGTLVLDTPDSDDPRFKELGMNWHHMKPQEHLWFFNQASLMRVITKAGMFVVEIDRPIQGKIVAYAKWPT